MRWLTILCLLAVIIPCHAHWASPGYLELEQTAANTYSVLWKVPTQAGRPLKLTPRLPQTCVEQTPASSYQAGNAVIQRWVTHCDGGLIDQNIGIDGLSNSLTDVLVRVNRLGGTTQTVRLTANASSFTVLKSPNWIDISQTYLVLGVEHILSGIDHLLFILTLLIIVSGWRRLVATITAFTLAHSLTLCAAALGFVYVPRPPVEAMIALSILFLAVEIVRHQLSPHPAPREEGLPSGISSSLHNKNRRAIGLDTKTDSERFIETDLFLWSDEKLGRPNYLVADRNRMQKEQSLTYQWPWLIAFTFGLLHGFGFAGALSEVGLPENAIPLALLFFNIGVELGQLLFVAGFMLLSWSLGRILQTRLRWVVICAAYSIGVVAAYWTIERVASFWA